jgi:hypothetical protein
VSADTARSRTSRASERHEHGELRIPGLAPQHNARRPAGRGRGVLHVHWYSRAADNPFGNGSLYACRCGVVKQSL